MHLERAYDLETVKKGYIDVIENTPMIYEYARWVYGEHPDDEMLQSYIDRGEMYVLKDGEKIAGLAAVSLSQGEDYACIKWQEDLPDGQAASIHLLAVCPEYRGHSLGLKIVEDAMEIAVKNGKKALRLDTLKSNIPAQWLYEKAGFSRRGEQQRYIENIGVLDFIYYEKLPSGDTRI